MLNQNRGLALHQMSEPVTAQGDDGHQQLQSDQYGDGKERTHQRNTHIFHGECGQFRDHDRHHKIKHRQLTDLAFPHHPQRDQHNHVQNDDAQTEPPIVDAIKHCKPSFFQS